MRLVLGPRTMPTLFGGRGRRLTDPPDRPPSPDTLAVRGRLAGVSVRASIAAGAWVGFALGLAIGTVLGALFVWFAGSVLDWQRDLAFTFGVTQRLLPFGDQIGLLRSVRTAWYVVIPATGLLIGAGAAVIGGLIGGLIAVTYNRSPRHALVIVELPRDVAGAEADLAAMASMHVGLEADGSSGVSGATGPRGARGRGGSSGAGGARGSTRMVDPAATVTTGKSPGGPLDRESGSKAGSPGGHGTRKVARDPRG